MALANALAIMLYLSCSVILIRRFLQKDLVENKALVPTSILAILALIFHATDLYFTINSTKGWDINLLSSLSIAAWFTAVFALLFGNKKPTIQPGMIIFPFVMISLTLTGTVPSVSEGHITSPALEWHILLSLASYGLFSIAAIQSVLLALQERLLRQRNISGLLRKLPPLESMENHLFLLIATGLAFLTIGLITGLLFVEDLFAQHLVHKTVLSLLAWCVFVILLWGRLHYGWRGTTAVRWTLVGFTFLVLAYFGSQFVLEYIIGAKDRNYA